MRVIRFVWDLGAYPRKHQWQQVLSMAEPFLSTQYLKGVESRRTSDRVLALVWTVVGDAHRELGRPLEAAEAYGKAFQFTPGTGCTDFYVKLVLKHSMTDHYATALEAMDVGSEVWRERSLFTRVFGHIISIVRSPWFFVSVYVPDRLLRGRRRRELQRRIAALEAE